MESPSGKHSTQERPRRARTRHRSLGTACASTSSPACQRSLSPRRMTGTTLDPGSEGDQRPCFGSRQKPCLVTRDSCLGKDCRNWHGSVKKQTLDGGLILPPFATRIRNHEPRNMRHGLYTFQSAGAKAMHSMPATTSKWASLLNTGRTCWRASAAIQTSLDGRGLPRRFSSRRMAA